MPVPGRKPAPEGPKHGHYRPEHAWTEVEEVPYSGPVPALPAARTVIQRGQQHTYELQDLTQQWWESVSAMPHCVLWTRSDWQFAISTALVADAAFTGTASAATELRNREKVLGVTADARRDLRIRYVSPEEAAQARSEAAAVPAEKVASLSERRRRLTGAP